MANWHRQLVAWGAAIFVVCIFDISALAQSGVLSLKLERQGPDGAIYRLRDALFLIRGQDTTFIIETEADTDTEVQSLDLRGGSYSIELMPGWRMERTVDDQTTHVAARLTSEDPQTFTVTPSEATEVIYRFEVANLQTGQLQLGLAVGLAPIDNTPVPTSCDPVAQTGCRSGEKCTSVGTGDNLFFTTCVPDGGRLEGEACTGIGSEGGSDDCAAGLFCVDERCERVCDVAAVTPGCGNCLQFGGIFEDREGVGVCQPTCDVLAQDCSSGENCYLRPSGPGVIQQFCAAPASGTGQQGDACEFVNSCDAGYSCVLPNSQNTGLECAFTCDALDDSPSCADGPGPSFTCVRMNEFFANFEGLDDRLGLCIDCNRFPTNPGCGN